MLAKNLNKRLKSRKKKSAIESILVSATGMPKPEAKKLAEQLDSFQRSNTSIEDLKYLMRQFIDAMETWDGETLKDLKSKTLIYYHQIWSTFFYLCEHKEKSKTISPMVIHQIRTQFMNLYVCEGEMSIEDTFSDIRNLFIQILDVME